MSSKILKILGWFYITLGLVCNQWVLGWLFSPEGSIDEPSSKAMIGAFEVLMIFWGALTLQKHKAELIINLNLLMWTVILITPILGEVMLRAGIALNIEQFKNPALYADCFSDDDYWKLRWDWKEKYGDTMLPLKKLHPFLGWTQADLTENDPLGLFEDTQKQLGSSRPKILFYGDSFVRGASDKEFEIPRYANSKISGVDVIDLSVGGYGIDQVYLMFGETYAKVDHSTIFVGILANDDLDRTVLSIRTSQKPYFVLGTAGDLQLKGIPIEKDQKKYFREYSLSIKSYLMAFLKNKFFLSDNKVALKKKISSKLLELFKIKADNAGDRLTFVLFYTQQGLKRTDWQETFLKNELSRLGLHYIDTKDLLLRYAREQHLALSAFYKQGNGHHNNLGNQVIADSIVKYLSDGGLLN